MENTIILNKTDKLLIDIVKFFSFRKINDKFKDKFSLKIKEFNQLLESNFYINDYSDKELKRIIKTFSFLLNTLESIKDENIFNAETQKEILISYKNIENIIDLINFYMSEKDEKENLNDSYLFSTPVLADDWDSQEDKQWDKF